MLMLVTVLFFPVVYVLGKAALAFLYGNGKQNDLAWEDCLLTGGLLFVGLAEGAHLGALVRGQSVSVACSYLGLLLTALAGLSLAFLAIRWFMRGKKKAQKAQSVVTSDGDGEGMTVKKLRAKLSTREVLLLAGVGIVFLSQLLSILFRSAIYLGHDQTLETVITFLKEDRLYGSNPLTGMPYTQGMPLRLKILCLPTLYAVICQATGADPEFLVWHLVPAATLILAFLAYRSLGRAVFPEKRERAYLFWLCAVILFWVGDAVYGLEGFGLLRGGFQGTTIRSAVFLPYLFGAILRKKWLLAALCVFAEACVVWTLYGAGMGLMTCAAFIVIDFLYAKLVKPAK